MPRVETGTPPNTPPPIGPYSHIAQVDRSPCMDSDHYLLQVLGPGQEPPGLDLEFAVIAGKAAHVTAAIRALELTHDASSLIGIAFDDEDLSLVDGERRRWHGFEARALHWRSFAGPIPQSAA